MNAINYRVPAEGVSRSPPGGLTTMGSVEKYVLSLILELKGRKHYLVTAPYRIKWRSQLLCLYTHVYDDGCQGNHFCNRLHPEIFMGSLY